MSTPSRPPASEAPRQLTFPLPPEINPEDYQNIEFISSATHLALGCKNSVWIYSLPAFDLIDTINPGRLPDDYAALGIYGRILVVKCVPDSEDFEEWCFLYIWDLSARKHIGTVICNCESTELLYTSVSLPSAKFSEDGKLEGTSPEWPQDPVLTVASAADGLNHYNLEIYVLHGPDAIKKPQGPLPLIPATEVHSVHQVRCLSSMGRTVATGGRDMSVRTWDIITGKCQMVFIGHTTSLSDVHLDEERIYSYSLDGTIIVWDRYKGDCLHVQGVPLPVPELPSSIRSVTPPYVVIANYTPRRVAVFVWDFSSGKFEHITSPKTSSLDWGPIQSRERTVATIEADEDPRILWFKIWDLWSGQLLTSSSLEPGTLRSYFLSQGRYFMGVEKQDEGYILKVWDFGANGSSIDARVGFENDELRSSSEDVTYKPEEVVKDNHEMAVDTSPDSSAVEDTLPGGSTISGKRKRRAVRSRDSPKPKRRRKDN